MVFFSGIVVTSCHHAQAVPLGLVVPCARHSQGAPACPRPAE
jgi:hypothetical protein